MRIALVSDYFYPAFGGVESHIIGLANVLSRSLGVIRSLPIEIKSKILIPEKWSSCGRYNSSVPY